MTVSAPKLGARVSAVRTNYMRLWTAFVDAAERQRLKAEVAGKTGPKISTSNGVATAEAIFFLRGWPFKAVSNWKSIDIAVKVKEEFSPDCDRIVKASTCVGYFRRKRKKCRPVLELHYDFERPTPEAHPVFHAHVDSTKWPKETLRDLGLTGDLEAADPSRGFGSARIPTAFMGFAPVLVALAADHLEPANFRTVLDAARQSDEGSRDPECNELAAILAEPRVPHAHYWYDDNYLVYEWRDEKKMHRAEVPVLKKSFEGTDAKVVRGKVLTSLGISRERLRFVPNPPPR